MTQIIVLTTEGDGNIGVSAAGGITPEQAIAYLKTAIVYYERMRFEAAVKAALAAQRKEQSSDQPSG